MKIKYQNIKRSYFVNGKIIHLGNVDCAGNCGCVTYGPLDGRLVFCYMCGKNYIKLK